MNNTIKALISLPLVLSSVACSSVDTTPTQQQVSTPTPVVSEFVGKSDSGYTYTFSEDNIRTRSELHRPGSPIDNYHVLKDTYRVRVTANGVVTDLTGKSTHSSNSVICKVGESVIVRHIKKYHVISSTGYQAPDVRQPDGSYYPGEYTQTKEDLGIITSDELKQLRANRPENTIYNVQDEYDVYDQNDTQVLPSKYVNQNNLICQAAIKFNLI